ncbi:MAG: hypothetical protein EXS13_15180 [Planctomycetes bacterium]|nr:hypothetical protein [Planctomycetota bacterium]
MSPAFAASTGAQAAEGSAPARDPLALADDLLAAAATSRNPEPLIAAARALVAEARAAALGTRRGERSEGGASGPGATDAAAR